MKKTWILGLMLGILIAGTALAAHQTFSSCQPRWVIAETFLQMHITEQQKREIAGILLKRRRSFQATIATLKSARMDLKQKIRADVPDKKAVLQAYYNLCTSGEKLILLLLDTLSEVKSALTRSQRNILKEGLAKLDNTLANRIKSRRVLLSKWIMIHTQ